MVGHQTDQVHSQGKVAQRVRTSHRMGRSFSSSILNSLFSPSPWSIHWQSSALTD